MHLYYTCIWHCFHSLEKFVGLAHVSRISRKIGISLVQEFEIEMRIFKARKMLKVTWLARRNGPGGREKRKKP